MTMACPHFHFMNECRHKVCRLWKGVVITMKIPQHVAIILDGNGRWAKSKGITLTPDASGMVDWPTLSNDKKSGSHE